MSITDEVLRIIRNIANAYDACRDKEAVMPAVENSDNLAECISSMESSGLLEDIVKRILDGENPVDLSELNEVEQYIANLIPRALSMAKTITENGTYIAKNDGVDGYSSVTVSIDNVNNTDLYVNPSTSVQTFTPGQDYTGFYNVRVNKVDKNIDSNIKASNIKKGVTILGVTGTYEVDTDFLFTMYPVGSIYIGIMAHCPLQTLMEGTTWEKINAGYVLQQAGDRIMDDSEGTVETRNIGQYYQDGLPDITGEIVFSGTDPNTLKARGSGAFSATLAKGAGDAHSGNVKNSKVTFSFNASDVSNSYGRSVGVQPAALAVNIWQRIG